jgi:carboxylate-amine ligase
VRTAAAADTAGEPVPRVRQELLRAANWRAARYGMSGELVDPVRAEALPAERMVERLVEHVRPALAEHGEEDLVGELLAAARGRGTSAGRQRAAYAHREDLRDVVTQLVAETARG